MLEIFLVASYVIMSLLALDILKLESKLKEVSPGHMGPRGTPGVQGPMGATGLQGEPGKDCEHD